jgi:hypothetical protein
MLLFFSFCIGLPCFCSMFRMLLFFSFCIAKLKLNNKVPKLQ